MNKILKSNSPGRKKFGRYLIEEEIGRGGMAIVYRAYDPRFQRTVAIKVLPRELLHDKTFLSRFEREARTIASLEHPAIVPVYDFGEEQGQPYIVMRYMSGGSLEEKIQDHIFSLSDAARIISIVAPALDEAHQRKIVHRDLKPGNILLDRRGDPHISDFGVVKLSQATTTLTGSGVLGTPAYMSPEQGRGDSDIDGRSDIYSMGAIFFHMLTGKLPYEATTPTGQIIKHITEPVPDILKLRKDLDPRVQGFLERAMSKRKEYRFQTMGEMADALAGIVAEHAHGETLASGMVDALVAPPISGETIQDTLYETVEETQSSPVLDPVSFSATSLPAKDKGKKKVIMFSLLAAVLLMGLLGGIISLIDLPAGTPSTPTPQENVIAFVGEASATPTVTELPTSAIPSPSPTFTLTPTQTPVPTETPTPTIAPTPLGGSGKILFAASVDGTQEIFAINIDGSALEQLTSETGIDYLPSWSSDRKEIVFVSNRDGNYEIYKMKADGSDQTRLTFNQVDDKDPSFSYDGSKIIFRSKTYRLSNFWDTKNKQIYEDVYVMSSDGSNSRPLIIQETGGTVFSKLDWYANDQLVFVSTLYGYRDIFLLDFFSLDFEPLVEIPGWQDYPSWSLDGKSILFTSAIINNPSISTICIIQSDGSGMVNITSKEAYYRYPRFSPDEKMIVYILDGIMYLMDRDGSSVREVPIPEALGYVTSLDW